MGSYALHRFAVDLHVSAISIFIKLHATITGRRRIPFHGGKFCLLATSIYKTWVHPIRPVASKPVAGITYK